MATIVLTAVGTAIGGPLGGAIGSILGQQVDRLLIGNGPKREGARLKELDVQTSSYGNEVAAIFGKMRVAGTVIWASDLIESRGVSGGGKSRPSTVNYSYSANLAVALSSRPILRIGRIWADGNLLRGAADDLKVETQLRIYNGHQDQEIDPMIAASEGSASCPAFRGIAYAVFEGLQLADFGNRIPSLTFEVIERDGPVPIHEIFAAAGADAITGEVNETVEGFALAGKGAKNAVAPLLSGFPITLRPDADKLVIESWFSTPSVAMHTEEVSDLDGKSVPRALRSRNAMLSTPKMVSIRHYAPERDYQLGVQRHFGHSIDSAGLEIDLPATINAARAKHLAFTSWLGQTKSQSRSVSTIGYSAQPLKLWQTDAQSGYRVAEIEHLRGCMQVSQACWPTHDPAPVLGVDAGRDVPAVDEAIGETLIELVDLPALAEPLPSQPQIGVIAAGTGAGWRRASLSLSDGDGYRELGVVGALGVIASLQTPRQPHNFLLEDKSNHPVATVPHDGMSFPPGTGNPYSSDAPILYIDGEFLRYGQCSQIGPDQYQFVRLLRGCFGTEDAVVAHAVDTNIALIDRERLNFYSDLGLQNGQDVEVSALGLADSAPVLAQMENVGLALRPPRPAHFTASKFADGSLGLSWKRRARFDPGWQDHVDVPVHEEVLRFSLDIFSEGTALASYLIESEHIVVSPTDIAGWGLAPGSEIAIKLRQMGKYSVSADALLTVML